MNTNDFGDVRTLATLSQVKPAKIGMDTTASGSNSNLVVVSGTNLVETDTFLHGVALADFAIVCGNLPGVTLWAPVQDECSLGTLDNNIEQTLFLDEVYINSLEFGYTTGANATENYGAETDMKMWLLNDGRFVNYDKFDLTGATADVSLTLDQDKDIAVLSGGLGFLRKDAGGAPAVTVFDSAANEVVNYEVIVGTSAETDKFVYHDTGTGHKVYTPTDITFVNGDRIEMIYAADAYGTATTSTYFNALDDIDRPDMIGALRQGQVEVFVVANDAADYDVAWRLTGCTITSDLTREPLAELGHLGPYDRPLTMPIPITVTVDTTAGDLENWSKVANKLTEFDGKTLDDIDLSDLMKSEELKLVVKVYAQTDEEAGGSYANRKIASDSSLIGKSYFVDGAEAVYSAANREYALKTIIVEHLKITDEGATLDMGANMTQTFGFRSTNDLYVVKGDVSIEHITGDFKVRRNS